MYHRGKRQQQAKPVSGLICLDAATPKFAAMFVHLRRCSRTGYNMRMPKSPRYTAAHASAGLDHKFPEIETWQNQFPGYEIVIDDPEFTSVCPKTGLPDFGKIEIRYMPDRLCLELKSLKEYLQSYRNLGIFQENIVNQVLQDVVRCAKPVWAEVKGDFRPRGGISTVVIARWPRPKKAGEGRVKR
jgi:7-cyano-7-deazaguanine reductase